LQEYSTADASAGTSEDLPVLIEIIDAAQKVDELTSALDQVSDIGLITHERVTVLRY